MKRFTPFKWMLFIVIVSIAIPLIIVEEIFRKIMSLLIKVRLNYQLMMFIYQYTR
jgi:hypothetical protein